MKINDLICLFSIIGIWPRFIEPKLLDCKYLNLPFPTSLKIVQITDLHLQPLMNDRFLEKVLKKIEEFKPDMIVIVGDFICNGQVGDPERLKNFLQKLKVPVYAVLGNHDYEKGIGINLQGDYDLLDDIPSPLFRGLQSIFTSNRITGKATDRTKNLAINSDLKKILNDLHIELLNNRTVQIGGVNITGIEEYMAGKAKPEIAFQGYDRKLPGIVLAHNPDAFPRLRAYPGNLVLAGHTHGGQINLPWIRDRFSKREYPQYLSGYYEEAGKALYISRGLGGIFPFRFNARPELVCITLGEVSV